jgi:hypothetical protein
MRLKAPYFLVIAGLFACPSTGSALNWNIVERLCIGDSVEPRILTPRVPVGCEVVDCCPGCPGPHPLQWEIRLNGRVLGSVELRFEGLPSNRMRQLKISGNAKLDGERILIRPGTSRIEGLRPEVGGRVPVGLFRVAFDRDAAARLPTLLKSIRAVRGDPDANSVPDGISVRQFIRGLEVNRFSSRYRISSCIRPPLASDWLRVQNIAAGDNVAVMMDSRASAGPAGCRNDEVLRTTSQLGVGNVLAAGACNSEIAVFAAQNAMALSTPVTTWTDSVGDIHTITMQPIINVPVSVWIANAGAAAQAQDDIDNANLIYGQKNKVGVQFVPTFHDVSANVTAVGTIGNWCNAIGAIRGSAWYTPNTLNIYYVNDVKPPPSWPASSVPGFNCDRFGDGSIAGDANITFIGTLLGNAATLAHEIGHAFGLRPGNQGGHSNDPPGQPGFGNNNVMWAGGLPTRDHFSLGQAFRMNTQGDQWGGTMLIANGLRPGPGRSCPPLNTSDICPPLALDWSRP